MIPKMGDFADGCNMRKLTSILIGGAIVAWMAYLSWPVTAELPRARQESVESGPMSKSIRPLQIEDVVEAYEFFQLKAVPQPSV
jgi:hypothetical protein